MQLFYFFRLCEDVIRQAIQGYALLWIATDFEYKIFAMTKFISTVVFIISLLYNFTNF